MGLRHDFPIPKQVMADELARIARQVGGQEARRQGFLDYRFLPGPRIVSVVPSLFGARLCLGGAFADDVDRWGCYEEAWDYADISSALAAMKDFTLDEEPDGWIRHTPSGRRRPGGDENKEYVSP